MPGKTELQEMASLAQALRTDWAETSQVWRDGVRDEFKRQFWDPWEAVLSDFLNNSNEISEEIDNEVRRLDTW